MLEPKFSKFHCILSVTQYNFLIISMEGMQGDYVSSMSQFNILNIRVSGKLSFDTVCQFGHSVAYRIWTFWDCWENKMPPLLLCNMCETGQSKSLNHCLLSHHILNLDTCHIEVKQFTDNNTLNLTYGGWRKDKRILSLDVGTENSVC